MPTAGGLHYELHGPPDAPPVLLSPGLGGSARYWAPNLAALAKHHRVIVYDHRGTGLSGRTVPGDLTLEALARDMVGLLDALDIAAVTLIGHAIGGMAGLALALAQPERLARLVVINGWAKLDPHTARCFDTRLALLRDSGRGRICMRSPCSCIPRSGFPIITPRCRTRRRCCSPNFRAPRWCSGASRRPGGSTWRSGWARYRCRR